MKRVTLELIFIFIFLAFVVVLNNFYDYLFLFAGIKNNNILKTGIPIIEIILILWVFWICKKVILTYKKREKRYRHLVDLSPEAIIVHRAEKIVYINQAGAKLLGVNSYVDILNYSWKEILLPDSYSKFRLLEEKSFLNHTFKAKRLDGTVFDLEIISTDIEFDGKPAREVVARDVTIRKNKEAIVKRYAYQDDLTGLPNRRSFMNTINKLVKHTEQNNRNFAIMFIDLDGFKQLNDLFGHEAGNAFLKQFSKHLIGCVSEDDTVARLGGDEFTILLTDATKHESAQVAKRIIEVLDSCHFSKDIKITPSIGIALYPQDGKNIEMLINQADYAMYQVKQQGKNGYKFINIC